MTKIQHRDRARDLRVGQTEAEARLWGSLRDRHLGGWKWRRQSPRGPFILDFLCAEAALAVELDGSQHQRAEAAAYDTRRTAWLARGGLRILRFESREVLINLDGVLFDIWTACGGDRPPARPSSGPSGHLLPRGEKGDESVIMNPLPSGERAGRGAPRSGLGRRGSL